MTDVPDGSGLLTRRASFRVAHAAEQSLEQQVFILDVQAKRPAVRSLKSWALDQLSPAAGETAVDVGSGTGEDVLAFARLGARAIGVEPSAALRAEAVRRAAGADVEYVEGQAEVLPFEDESVDVLRSERVLQHVDDPAAVVKEMARVLRPGGRIALIDTDWDTAIIDPADPEVLGRMVGHFLAESANPYSGRRLRGLLAGAGLDITGETAATMIEPQEGARQGFVTMMVQTSVEAGAITQAEADTFAATLAEAADRGAFHLSLTMYAVSAVKPRAAGGN
jgi:ubiquinone/menaquinone biosynthesis C-methylase UbiE